MKKRYKYYKICLFFNEIDNLPMRYRKNTIFNLKNNFKLIRVIKIRLDY